MNRTPKEWAEYKYDVPSASVVYYLARAIEDITTLAAQNKEQASRIAALEVELEQAVVNSDRQLRLIATLGEREDKMRAERDVARLCADCDICWDEKCKNAMRERGKG